MIAIGSDHAGFEMKEKIKLLLGELHVECRDFGTSSTQSADYPDFAHQVAVAVGEKSAEWGILVCGSGIGMSIVANKHAGVRAANVESIDAARLARQHNNANVLALGARLTTWDRAREIITIFLSTPFEGGRHAKRVEKIHTLTNL
jgi:ribose 5-phosphate isomerase B